ncbi:MAG: Crp/Fnr family transcriptional regulator [Desulfovibrionaceae bacterium]|nr:Crp/Fnr family transcriptional regulator [Desulfovibrionaceae bacterium]
MEKQWYLRDREFFSKDFEAQKKRFLEAAVRKVFQKGDIIFLEGEIADRCHYVASGVVRTFNADDSGRDSVVFLRREGEMFGLAEALSRAPRRASAQALTNVELFCMPSADLDRFLAEDYQMARRVITLLGGRLCHLNDLVSSFATGSVLSRLAGFLVTLVYEHIADGGEGSPVEVPVRVTQELMASVTGSTQPTISETLQRLQQEGVISIERRKITILNPPQLMAYASIAPD